jgi:glycine betaine/proline transport system ATP-binding protein
MIMQHRALMAGGDGHVWLDAERRYRLSLDASDQAIGLQLDGVAHALSPVRDESDLTKLSPGLAVAPGSMSLQSIIQLRQTTGHPVLLAEDGRILGVCCQTEIIRALAGGRHTSADGS